MGNILMKPVHIIAEIIKFIFYSRNSEYTFENMCQDLLKKHMTEEERDDLYYEFSKPISYEQLCSKLSTYTTEIKFKPTNSTTEKNEIESIKLRKLGDKYFNNKIYHLSLKYFTESIAIAPFNSESLALSYANRSAVLKSLKLYKDCINDIEKAIKYNYPCELLYKLKLRLGQCYVELNMIGKAKKTFLEAEQLIKTAYISEELKEKLLLEIKSYRAQDETSSLCSVVTTNSPILRYEINSELPAMSTCVQLKYSKERGRHLVATCDIKPGSVIGVESPYSAILAPENRFTHCSHCFIRCHALLPCPNCAWALFCSETCQTAARQAYHRLECSVMPNLVNLKLNTLLPAQLAIRTLLLTGLKPALMYHRKNQFQPIKDQRTRGFNTEGKFVTNNFSVIYHQCMDVKYTIAFLIGRVLLADCIVKILQLDNLPIASEIGGLLLHLMRGHSLNCHEIYERFTSDSKTIAKDIVVGHAVYPTIGLINHSCDQNVVRHYYGKDTVIRAIRIIKKGEEILDTYGPHFVAERKHVRQLILQTNQHFECECEACVNDWPTQLRLPWTKPGSNGKASAQVNEAIVNYVTHRKVLIKNIPMLCKCLAMLENSNKKLTQEYYVIQEIVKVGYARMANYYCCKDS